MRETSPQYVRQPRQPSTLEFIQNRHRSCRQRLPLGFWVPSCLEVSMSSSIAVFVRGISTDFPQPLSSKFVLDLYRHQMEWRFRLHKLTTVTLENVPFYLTLPH